MVAARAGGAQEAWRGEARNIADEGDCLMIARSRLAALLTIALVGISPAARADETVSTFSLDALSFISFGDQQILLPASGSSVRFHFGAPAADGSIPFTIAPSDVSIAPIPLPAERGDASLLDRLAGDRLARPDRQREEARLHGHGPSHPLGHPASRKLRVRDSLLDRGAPPRATRRERIR